MWSPRITSQASASRVAALLAQLRWILRLHGLGVTK